ncbi:MAG: hypothetical protein LAP40_15165 [Acidobacteriia bacterium]|nr:hypothetical protein [Terriglobia bacterium]
MRKGLLLVALLTAGLASGHHNYAAYDRDTLVSLEGTVQQILWGNPHVVITLRTENKGEYTVEWGSVFQLSRAGIKAAPVKQGDHLIVTGSVNKDPEKHILTLVRSMSRPADGWHWADPRYPTTP